MSAITRIDARIVTGNRTNAGTSGEVYLGICGREFRIQSPGNDFKKGADRTYILGVGASVKNPTLNDPRSPSLDTDDLDNFPKYIRFDPAGANPKWNLEEIVVTINPGAGQRVFSALNADKNLWLGQKSGKFCFLI